jgi:hypothetical protein
VTAACGIVLTGAVDRVVTSSTGGHSGTLVVLVFFVLAGITLIRSSCATPAPNLVCPPTLIVCVDD